MGSMDGSSDDDEKTVGVDPNTARSHTKNIVTLDQAVDDARFRQHWWQLHLPADPPPPPPASLDDATEIPLATASIFSMLFYHWITPMIILGYQRSLQAQDLWKMDKSREAGGMSKKLDESWARRCTEADEWNAQLDRGELKPPLTKRIKWRLKSIARKGRYEEYERYWREVGGKRQPSLVWALNDVVGYSFWAGGFFKVVGDTSQLMGPLVSQQLIKFGQERAANPDHPPNIGRGVAMALGLCLLTITASIANHQFFWRSMQCGVLARAAMISSLYKRGVTLTTKERTKHSNAALINHMSTDISRVDFAAQWFHAVWTAPIQVIICLVLLLVNLGPSALAGFAIFVLLIPLQKSMMALQFKVRHKSMQHTDARAGILQELLGAMRVIKYFVYEKPFLHRIESIRHSELVGIRHISMIKAANQAIAFSVPALASVLAFVVYSASGHDQNPAVIFTSLGLFQLLRQPLMFFPRALSALTDARNAFGRLTPVWLAKTIASSVDSTSSTIHIDSSSVYAIHIENANFQWEEPPPARESTKRKQPRTPHRIRRSTEKAAVAPASTPNSQEPFSIKDISLSIPKGGQVYAVVGPVGSGKSSLLQALIGEMKQTKADEQVMFGGKVAYCAQVAWIQNASLRDNVVFGAEWDEDKYWQAVTDAALLMDLEILPDGDLTEIGEKGINLSGGQKQRVNIARALYADADIVIMDDPLSAVDAHVGEALFSNAILAACKARGKTVLLVTHALHFLPQVDYILHMVGGKIVERGTYEELVTYNGGRGSFAKLLTEFSLEKREAKGEGDVEEVLDIEVQKKVKTLPKLTAQEVKHRVDLKTVGKAAGTGRIEGRLMQAEKRTTGSIDKSIYTTYIKAGNGLWNMPLIVLSGLLMQIALILTTYWLVWWEANTFHQSTKFYMGLYAALGIAQSFFTFALGGTMAILSFYACVNLHRDSVRKIFHAPMSFFDTTPLGRILSVLGKDIDTTDNQLADSLRMFVLVLSSLIGSIVIITILLHYFLIAVVVLMTGYWYFAEYYRVSARELKRLDGNLRSLLYSHFSESLGGLATIRAYGAVNRFLRDNEYFTDLEDRALFLTITNQRWLAIRLDFMGAIMVFVVGVMAAAGVNGINPAQIGLVLVYCISLTQLFGVVTRQSAEVENNMNAVERIVHYTKDGYIEQEAAYELPETKPPAEWPKGGSLQFKDVVMKYRPNLPPVLHGISVDIRDGEKIGVVGRTGAGKSSLMVALYRIVELSGGSIWLDGIDISTLGLFDLRSKISIIPQDPLLFSGTIRSNLDPFSRFEDAKLYDALRRAHLVTAPPTSPAALLSDDGTDTDYKERPAPNRFTLETAIEPEGANLSVGERSLLSLARALVRDEIKLVVMDEATASVDMETDSAIQETISREFGGKTLLCIAHRLRTIIHYDRVLVLEQGKVAEFDTPLNLFRRDGGIFRALCEQSKISEEEISS